MKQASTLLLLCAALASLVSATSHGKPKHRREFSSPTAVPRLAKRQGTLAQLQEALDSFLATANGTSTSSSLTAIPAGQTPLNKADAGVDEETTTTSTPSAVAETSAQTPSTPASIVVGAGEEAPTSSPAATSAEAPPTSAEAEATTSSTKEQTRPEPTDDATTTTTSKGGLGDALSSILIGEPTTSPATSSEAEETTTSTKPKPTDVGISIGIPDPETATKTSKPVSDDPEPSPEPVTTTSEKPIEITIGLPEEETTTTRRVEPSSTPDGIGITIGEPETTTRRESTTTTADEPSITIAPPEDETTTRRPQEPTTTKDPEPEPETTTSKGGIDISISIDLPTLVPSSKPETTEKPSTREASSTRDEPRPPQSSDDVSITVGPPSEDPKPSRSSTADSTSPTRVVVPSHTTSHGGISISIDLPSIVPNATVIIPSSRPDPTGRPSSDLESSTRGSPTSFSGVVPSSRPAQGGNASTVDASPSSRGSVELPAESSSRGPVGGNFTEPAGPSSIQSSGASQPTQAIGNGTVPSSSASEGRSSSEVDTASSTKDPNSFYNFVPTSTLMVNTESEATTTLKPTSATGSILEGNSAADESISSLTLATALPSSLPAKIVPGNAPASIPEDATLVSLMFAKSSMGWEWVVQSPDTAAQVLAYMPQLLASSLNVSESDIQSTALVAYQGLTDSSAKQLMTVYLASLPSDQVANLQAQVKTPSSLLYQQDAAILKQLSQQLVATFPVTAFTSTEQATIGVNGDEDGSSGGSDKKKNNTTVIAVVASFGSVIILLLAFVAFRYMRRNKNSAPNLRALQLNASASPISSPQMQQAPGGNRSVFSGLFTSHHYASSPESRRSYGSDSSGHSSAHSIGGNNREVQRGISWYSGRYTDFGEDEHGSPRSRSVYGQAITQDLNSPANPFGDRHASGGDGDEAAWVSRSEGVRRLKTGQVQISRPQLEGNSLML